jgi:hypothetical protein
MAIILDMADENNEKCRMKNEECRMKNAEATSSPYVKKSEITI